MENIKSSFGLFVIAWFAFAFFELSFDREIFRAYVAFERVDYDPDDGKPRLLPRAVAEYRVQQESVVSRIRGEVDEYDVCTVFDRDNWTCTLSDASGTLGARKGEFFIRTNLENSVILKKLAEVETLSRFRYIMLQCRWDATGGMDAILCLFRPFTT